LYDSSVYRLPVVLSSVAVIAGLILALAMESMLGALLIVGGVAGLGWSMAPAAIELVARWLSAGR
jgi:hypothetical protein